MIFFLSNQPLIFFQPRTHEFLLFCQGCLSPCFQLKSLIANIGPTSHILNESFPFDCSVVIWSFENTFQRAIMLLCPGHSRRAPPRKEGFEYLHQALHLFWCSAHPSPCPPSRSPQPLRFSPSLYQPGQRWSTRHQPPIMYFPDNLRHQVVEGGGSYHQGGHQPPVQLPPTPRKLLRNDWTWGLFFKIGQNSSLQTCDKYMLTEK